MGRVRQLDRAGHNAENALVQLALHLTAARGQAKCKLYVWLNRAGQNSKEVKRAVLTCLPCCRRLVQESTQKCLFACKIVRLDFDKEQHTLYLVLLQKQQSHYYEAPVMTCESVDLSCSSYLWKQHTLLRFSAYTVRTCVDLKHPHTSASHGAGS